MDPLTASLAKSPELFPYSLDLRRDMVTLLRLTRADYETASFLDTRIKEPGRPGRQLPWPQLERAVTNAELDESCHFIFHIGHVGSTLLSRLLGKHPGLFSLREPEILRTIAGMEDASQREAYLPACLKLWSRTFDPRARALLKATSFVSEIADQLLGRVYCPKALVMGVSPEVYLATIFGGENAPMEARMLAPSRRARLEKRLGGDWRRGELSKGEIVALGWACEASALMNATQLAGARVCVLDFERFLGEPQTVLARLFEHFDVPTSGRDIDAILTGAEMKTYAKAPEFTYGPELRRIVLEQGRRLYAGEIRRGLKWLDRTAHEHPSIAGTMTMFAV